MAAFGPGYDVINILEPIQGFVGNTICWWWWWELTSPLMDWLCRSQPAAEGREAPALPAGPQLWQRLGGVRCPGLAEPRQAQPRHPEGCYLAAGLPEVRSGSLSSLCSTIRTFVKHFNLIYSPIYVILIILFNSYRNFYLYIKCFLRHC